MRTREEYKIVGYTGKSGKLGTYKMIGKAPDKFNQGKERAHLKSFDGSLDFWVPMEKIEDAPPPKKRSSCSCEDDCCIPYCRCESHCNCNGGPIYDC